MPYIKVMTNVVITQSIEIDLKEQLGKDISIFSEKSEKWLMLSFEEKKNMWFSGSGDPLAIAEVSFFSQCDDDSAKEFTCKICCLLAEKLSIPEDRIYVKYSVTPTWGWNGRNF